MKYNDLKLTTNRSKRRVGRGIAAGQGKTAGRGTKGQKARSGSNRKPGFEGGQNPLMLRLPKLRGFRSIRPKAEVIYTGQLANFKGKIDNFSLAEASIISTPYSRVKLLHKGNVTQKVTVNVQSASDTAIAAIQKAGGNFVKTPQVKRQKTKETTQA
ncbi:MAG TPA: 50S ribosomal protein L15 [Niastella sp.]|nr:50S ribosomal protein L15 [Niastella sp.]